MLLGFSKRSPTPDVLSELGWMRLSTEIIGERWRLLRRLLQSENILVHTALEASMQDTSSWIHSCIDSLRPWCDGDLPNTASAWRKLFFDWSEQMLRDEAEEQTTQCESHPNLAHYNQVKYLQEGNWAINNFLHSPAVNTDSARRINRLLVGGQGLRAGDPRNAVDPTCENCCVFCLEAGIKAAETLIHVTFTCPAYAGARCAAPIVPSRNAECVEIFTLHQNYWSWRDLRSIRTFFNEVVLIRQALTGTSGWRAAALLQDRANSHWTEASV